MHERTRGLEEAAAHARRFLETVGERPVGARVDAPAVRAALGDALPDEGVDPELVIEELARGVDAGLVASQGPRHFGFVIGGALPAALAADWLVSAWDQVTSFHVLAPGLTAVEEIAAEWILELLGLPGDASVGFTTGAQGANTVGLAAARHRVLERAGHDAEREGLIGAPPVTILVGAQAHATIFRSLRVLGFGADSAQPVAADAQGRMRADALREALAATDGPTIVCAQAGNVATGAFDPLEEIAAACRAQGAWLHVDGAFGLWAAASPSKRDLARGAELADSWAVDAHKWLNVPYDCAMAIVRDPAAHIASMSLTGAYLVATPGRRDSTNYVLDSSRRGRSVPVYAALRQLGRSGVAELIDRCCAHARRMAAAVTTAGVGAQILNDVVLNQVLVRFPGGDAANRRIIERVQQDGTCWLGGTDWEGEHVMRISFSNWSTTDDDVDRSARAIVAAAAA